jgi:hypothetical protein
MLFVVSCLLLVICYSLFVGGYLLFVIQNSLNNHQRIPTQRIPTQPPTTNFPTNNFPANKESLPNQQLSNKINLIYFVNPSARDSQ